MNGTYKSYWIYKSHSFRVVRVGDSMWIGNGFWRRGAPCHIITAAVRSNIPPSLHKAFDNHIKDCDTRGDYAICK